MASFEHIDWYDTPRWYDLVFDVGTRDEADFLEAVARKHGGSDGRRVLEPGCGSGRLVAELARRKWEVDGFDLNERMLAFARERLRKSGARAHLVRGDMSTFSVRGRFDLAHCLVSTFKYLLDERSAVSHLACVARALAPGGVYVLGFHLSDYSSRSRSRERWVARAPGARVVCNTQVWPPDKKARVEEVRTRLQVRTHGATLRSETRWRFRTYDVQQVRRLLARVPALEHVETYDFTHRIDRPRELDGELLDVVLVLRRRDTRRTRVKAGAKSRSGQRSGKGVDLGRAGSGQCPAR